MPDDVRDELDRASVRLRRALDVIVGDRVDPPALELRHAVEQILSILERVGVSGVVPSSADRPEERP